MAGLNLNEYSIETDTHTVLATTDVLNQVLLVKDADKRQIFQTAERARPNPTSTFKNDAPYALLAWKPISHETTGLGTITKREIEILLTLVFRLGSHSDGSTVDLQAWSDGLSDLTFSYLMPKLIDNPNGMGTHTILQPETGLYAALWNWKIDAKFRDNIDRKITAWEPAGTKVMTGSRYAVHLQMAMTVHSSIDLTNAVSGSKIEYQPSY